MFWPQLFVRRNNLLSYVFQPRDLNSSTGYSFCNGWVRELQLGNYSSTQPSYRWKNICVCTTWCWLYVCLCTVSLEGHLCFYYMLLVVCMPTAYCTQPLYCWKNIYLQFPPIVPLEEHLRLYIILVVCILIRSRWKNIYLQFPTIVSLEEHLCFHYMLFVVCILSTQLSYRWKNIFVQFPTIVSICFLHGIRCIFLHSYSTQPSYCWKNICVYTT